MVGSQHGSIAVWYSGRVVVGRGRRRGRRHGGRGRWSVAGAVVVVVVVVGPGHDRGLGRAQWS